MGYVVDNLMADEKIIHTAKVHWLIFIQPIILIFVGLVIAIGLPEIIVSGLLIVLVGLIVLVNAFIFKFSTELAVTTKRVIAKSGLIRRTTLELNHSKVESFTIDQSILGRILNFGTVIVRGTGKSEVPIPNIDDPILFRKKAMEIIDINSIND